MDNNESHTQSKRKIENKENSFSINAKKTRRESIDEEFGDVKHRRAKMDREGSAKQVENLGHVPAVSNQNMEKYGMSKLISSNLYDYTTKNDVLNIIWKITAQKEDFLGNNSELVFNENYFSKRNDGWYFQIDQINGGRNSYCTMRVSLKCIDEKVCREDSYLAKIFKNVNFEVEVSFQLVNYKTQNYTIKNLNYNTVESKDIQIPIEFYASNSNPFYSSTRSNKTTLEKQDDEVIIILELSIQKNFPSLINNKEITGFTGIVNEAATCYMNSMLQTLNIFGSFKRAVFQIPTADEDYHSVALSLQRLFYDLMTDSCPVSTNRLVRSFGWGREQMLIQHDVQEFNILLSDIMEKKMKGTPGEGTFNKLFAGILNNYIQCVNVDYKSNKEEKFTDLQLTVKGCNDIYQSLNSYIEEEILDNADKYYAEGFGKQKASKGIRFVKFPSVLIIQLKRFEYNPKKEAMVKINDYFEFYEEIDLCRYLIKNSSFNDYNDDNKYTLHSVVVHQGNANSGHYYAYIRPTMKDFWIQYNDEIVRPADKYEVFKNNYGGNYKTFKHKSKGEIITNSNCYESNAYILVYIKNSERKNILNPINSDDIPATLRNRFEHEKNEDRKLLLKKMRMTDNLNLILITKENVIIQDNQTSRLGIITPFADLDKSPPLIMNKYSRLLLNFPRNLTLENFLNFIQKETNIPIELMKLYEYESGNTSIESLIKCRSDYELIPIDKERLKKYLYELTNNYKRHIVSLFLYVDDHSNNLKVLKSNTSKSNEEIKIGDQLVLISKEINKFTLYQNSNRNKFDSINLLNDYRNDEDFKLIFIKELHRQSGTLRITKIIHINLSIIKDYDELSDKIKYSLSYDYEGQIYFLIENTCLNEINDTPQFLEAINYKDLLNKSSSLIVIPISEKEYDHFLSKIDEMYKTISIDLYCPAKKSYLKNKFVLNLNNCQDELQIKHHILKEINSQNKYKDLINVKDHYFIDQCRDIKRVDVAFLEQFITEENIELFQERDSSPRFFQACKETPILKYINQADCRIDINLTLFVKQSYPEFFLQNISIFDLNNNRICLLSVFIPKKIKRCHDVIDYLYDIVLKEKDFYSEILEKENFFFILQNPNENYIYQMLIDNNSELLIYEGKAERIEYRLQPFRVEEIECFKDGNYMKIFVSFFVIGLNANDKIKFEPITIFVRKRIKLFELKFLISEKLKHMRGFENLNLLNSNNHIFKFFTSKVENNKMKKDLNLQHWKEDEAIENILKDVRINNILCEIAIQNEK